MDLLDIYVGKFNQTMTANYYENLPTPTQSNCISFDYEYVDSTQWRYQKLFGNITTNNASRTTIKTNSNISVKIGGYIVLPDGILYSVNAVAKDYRNVSKQALRSLKEAVGTELVIQLIEKNNAWGIK